mgnify:CR=1 FL=1
MAIETGFDIPAIEISTFELTLVGDSPLIVHAWSEKAKKEILDKQMKVAKTKVRSIRNPAADFIDSLYWLTKNRQSLPWRHSTRQWRKGRSLAFPLLRSRRRLSLPASGPV